MRPPAAFVLALGLGMTGCGDGRVPLPTAPTTRPEAPLPPPTGTPRTFSQRIEVGDIVEGVLTAHDPLCDPGWPYRCRYYGLTVPSTGTLLVTIAWNPEISDPYPLDMGVTDERGREWASAANRRGDRIVAIPVTEGATYVIEVWSFRSPDEPFQLRTSLSR